MTGKRPSLYWMICWKFVSPVCMIVILSASVVEMLVVGSTYEAWNAETATKEVRPWPPWAQILAGCLACMSVLWIPVVALLK